MENTVCALEDAELDQVSGGLSDAAKTGLVMMAVGLALGGLGLGLNAAGGLVYAAHKNDGTGIGNW
jgi:hypothetical protein